MDFVRTTDAGPSHQGMPFGSVEPDTAGLPVGVSSAADSSLSAMPFVSSSASDSDDVVVSSTRFKTFAIALDLDATQVLADWAEAVEASGETNFRKAQLLASRLGAHCQDDGSVSIGFWAPELAPGTMLHKDAYLEIFTPLETVDFSQPRQTIRFQRDCIPLQQQGEFVWGVVNGLVLGDRHQLGSLYWLRCLSESLNPNEVGLSVRTVIYDVLATSLPFGVFAPAEVYDFNRLQRERPDLSYFANADTTAPSPADIPAAEVNTANANAAQAEGQAETEGQVWKTDACQVPVPANILQVHVGTASPQGTIAGLTEVYRRIARKLESDSPLTPAEQNFIGYDAVQLLPVEPIVEPRGLGHQFWETLNDDPSLSEVGVVLHKPDTQNWGYDIVLSGMAATNPSQLASQRPDELVDFIATLHTFPTGPIQLIYDIVYGHADNQALDLINGRYLKGPNMYGQDVNHQNPTVRAILLELQRRKVNTGADGVRIDGAQDIKFFNPLSGMVEHDDGYLQAMADVEQEIGGHRRKLFCVFEDGRPWPEEGWEHASTYMDLVRLIPDSYQWGPLIFAHNTPALDGFWNYKWNRLEEVMQHGAHWITGCGNHDTVRRGTQIDPEGKINWNLGDTLFEVFNQAYDNPAMTLLTYGFMPGLPMDFINATARAPWGFLRNTDDYYGVKVVSEEGGFLEWQVPPEMYAVEGNFERLKAFGFNDYDELKAFIRALHEAISVMEFNLREVARICQDCLPGNVDFSTWEDSSIQNYAPSCATYARTLGRLIGAGKSEGLSGLTMERLQGFAKAFMEDCHDICNVSLHADKLDAAQTGYNLAVRQFRRDRPWLRHDLREKGDIYGCFGEEAATVFYGVRTEVREQGDDAEDDRVPERVAIVAHLGGEPIEIDLASLLHTELDGWSVAIASPGVDVGDGRQVFELQDSQAVVLVAQG